MADNPYNWGDGTDTRMVVITDVARLPARGGSTWNLAAPGRAEWPEVGR
jgi:hypothetical protein